MRHYTNAWPTGFRRGSPMICKLWVRNHTGLDQVLPPLVEKRAAPRVPPGGFACEIQLDYTAYNGMGVEISGLPPPIPETVLFDELPWHSVARRPGTSLEFRRAGGALGPAEEFDVLEFDLGRLFDIKQSGCYAVYLKFSPNGTADSKPADRIHDFVSFAIADPLPPTKP